MAATKKATHVITHRKQYMAVGGKLQHVPAGTEVAFNAKQGDAMEARGRAVKIGAAKALDLSADEKGEAPAKPDEKTDK
jgi:hypothetical protein